MEISYTRQPTVTTDKNGYTEDQQTQYITRTAKELVKKERKVQEETLSQDKNWIDSAKILYQMQEDAEGELPPDEELSTWALDYVGQIQYNLVSGANAALEFQDADDMQKIAMRYAMETYDMKDITAAGAMRFAKGLATDPTTYIGLGSFGVGFGAKAAASQGAKKAFMQFLSKPANLAAVEGAMYGAAESGVQQNIEVATGARDEVDLGEVAMTAGIGAVAGKTLGEGIEYLGKKFSKKEVDEIQQEGQVIAQDIQANIGFAPELLGGSVNGLNYDEETGEFTFDPIRFMEGFLGGHVAKKIATNPKLNAKAKKEAMEYAQRTYDKLKDKPWFNYLTGTHRVIDDAPGVAKEIATPKVIETIDKTTRDANFKKWFEGSKVVDDNGEPLVVYHGTPSGGFEEFDLDKTSKSTLMSQEGPGIYFTDKIELAKKYTESINKSSGDLKKEIYPVYLSLRKPINLSPKRSNNIKKEDAYLVYENGDNEWFFTNWIPFDASGSRISKEEINTMTKKEKVKLYVDNMRDDKEILNNISRAYKNRSTQFDNMRKYFKADGVVYKENKLSIFVAWQPNQIKSINNKGAFSKDGNILKSAMIVPVGAGAVAATQQDEGL